MHLPKHAGEPKTDLASGQNRKGGLQDQHQLGFWNGYLSMNQLPEIDTVGTGLPGALRRRDGHQRTTVAALLTLGASAAGRSTAAAPVGSDDDDDEEGKEDEDDDANANDNDTDEDQPPSMRRRISDGS